MPPREGDLGTRRPGGVGPQREGRDAELAAAGWQRRFTGAPPRLAEVTQLYEALGWEVLLDNLSPDELPEDCGDCSLALSFFQVVYTKRGPGDGPERDDLN